MQGSSERVRDLVTMVDGIHRRGRTFASHEDLEQLASVKLELGGIWRELLEGGHPG